MKKYANNGGNSNIIAYEYGDDYIRVQFSSGPLYTYSYLSAGNLNVEKMKQLADMGQGLNSYIMRFARTLYMK